jgi:hypothetical protein
METAGLPEILLPICQTTCSSPNIRLYANIKSDMVKEKLTLSASTATRKYCIRGVESRSPRLLYNTVIYRVYTKEWRGFKS